MMSAEWNCNNEASQMHMWEADLTSLFLWHRWFFLPLESAVWQPGVATFLTYSQYTELQIQEWETSLKLNWTKTVYQRSSPPMAVQVREPILVSKTSIQCIVEVLPKMICTLLVLSFLGKGSWKGFHNKYAMYTYSFLFVFMPTLTRVPWHASPILVLTLFSGVFFAQLRFFYKMVSRERDHCVGLQEERYQLWAGSWQRRATCDQGEFSSFLTRTKQT